MPKAPLTVVVLTKNEEDNIVDCLKSVTLWADEVIVVDDGSTDKTVKLATQLQARVIHRKMENEGVHRNWAIDQARNKWVLSLDADEMVMPELAEAIAAQIVKEGCVAYSIPLRNYIGDYWVRHSGWYPARKLRLFHKDHFKYEEAEVHPRVILDGKEGLMHADIIHKGYPDFEHFMGSVNRQTTLEAKKWLRTGQKITIGRVVRRALDRFFRVYFKGRAFKDGLVGFMIAYIASLYQVLSYAKYWEMKRKLEG